MKRSVIRFCCIGIFLLLITASACVAPPSQTDSQASGSKVGSSGSKTSSAAAMTSSTPMYVTIETPYGGTTPVKVQSATPTTVPPEEWVEIYRSTQSYSYNTTAISYNLKNPPMVISFTVKPINVTGTKEITDPYKSHKDITVKYDYYSPYSWFEVTVRDKNTGQIVLQDGFGNSYGGRQYPAELNRTVKVLNYGDFLIEMSGNQITSTIKINVKKEGNIATT